MDSYDYVVVGAGIAGNSTVEGIRSVDTTGSLLVVGSDPHGPYFRPSLSKDLWRGETPIADVLLHDVDAASENRVAREVTAIDTVAHTATLDDGTTIGYRVLVLATGGEPRVLDGVPLSARVMVFRTLDDYEALRATAGAGRHVIVVGGGFIGQELAAGLAMVGTQVTYVFSGSRVGDSFLPVPLAAHVDAVYQKHGITPAPGRRASSIAEVADGVRVTLDNGEVIDADAVVLGLGIEPNLELARSAELEIHEGGVVVDELLRTSDPAIFAAGDIVSFIDPALGRRRVAHENAASTLGHSAGRNAAGANEPYTHTPFFYSDLFDDGYEAIGTLDAGATMVIDWKVEGEQAVVYYLDDAGVLEGVLLWNVWGNDDHDTKALATALLADRRSRSADELLGSI